MKFIHSGKVKDVYELDEKNLLFHFTDRVSAFDVPMITNIKGKGEILCNFAEFWFTYLDSKNHMVRLDAKDKMVVKKLRMIQLECVVRGYLYGSLYERYIAGNNSLDLAPNMKIASKLKDPIFDPTTKSKIHDQPISEDQILAEKPSVVVTLGAYASNLILGGQERLSKIHGNFFPRSFSDNFHTQIVPLFHPSFLLINPGMKKSAWMDMKKIMDFIQENRLLTN